MSLTSDIKTQLLLSLKATDKVSAVCIILLSSSKL